MNYPYTTLRIITPPTKNRVFVVGKDYGLMMRKQFGLDQIDKDSSLAVKFILPEEVVMLSDSFIDGLLWESVKRNGIESRHDKYLFQIDNQHCRDLIENAIVTSWEYLYRCLVPISERYKAHFDASDTRFY